MRPWVLVLAFACFACRETPAPAPPAQNGDDLVGCKTDDDCNVACGPCHSGEPIRMADRTRGCAVNPCPGAIPICAPDRTCRIK